jgi:MFS family permease
MKKPPSLRSIVALSLMIFFISSIQEGIGPLLVIYLRLYLGWNISQIGIALASTTIVAAIFQMPSGLVVDATRFKRLVIVLACGFIILSCGIFLAKSIFSFIIIAQSLIGVAYSLIPPAINAITLGLVGRERFPERVTINEAFLHAGTVLTILTIGILGQLYSHLWIIYGTILFSIFALIPLLFINPHEIDHTIARELTVDNSNATPVGFLKLFRSKPILTFFSAAILFYTANAAQLPLVAQKLTNIDPSKGPIFMASCIVFAQIIMIIVAYTLKFLINKSGRKPIFLFAFVFLIIRAVSFSFTENQYYLIALEALDGISAGIFSIMGLVIVSDLAVGTGRFNFLLGVFELCVGVGASISNLAAGFIAKAYGFHAGFLSLASIATVSLLLYTFILPETKH